MFYFYPEDDQYKEIKKLAIKYNFKVRTQPLLPVGRGMNLYDTDKHITFDELQKKQHFFKTTPTTHNIFIFC